MLLFDKGLPKPAGQNAPYFGVLYVIINVSVFVTFQTRSETKLTGHRNDNFVGSPA